LLINFAIKNKIILELNEKDKYGRYPLLEAISEKNIEWVKLFIVHANKFKITL